jgi:hypothetical protein
VEVVGRRRREGGGGGQLVTSPMAVICVAGVVVVCTAPWVAASHIFCDHKYLLVDVGWVILFFIYFYTEYIPYSCVIVFFLFFLLIFFNGGFSFLGLFFFF